MLVDSISLLPALGPLSFVVISIGAFPNPKTMFFTFMPVPLIYFAIVPFKLTFSLPLIVEELASVDAVVVDFHALDFGVFVEEPFEDEIFGN